MYYFAAKKTIKGKKWQQYAEPQHFIHSTHSVGVLSTTPCRSETMGVTHIPRVRTCSSALYILSAFRSWYL